MPRSTSFPVTCAAISGPDQSQSASHDAENASRDSGFALARMPRKITAA